MKKETEGISTFFKTLILLNALGVILLAGGVVYLQKTVTGIQKQTTTPIDTIKNVTYTCSEDKTIEANFYEDKVELSLSDERNLLLMQALSGSGVRYTNSDESTTFWTKGNTAYLQEGEETTFNNCVESTQ